MLAAAIVAGQWMSIQPLAIRLESRKPAQSQLTINEDDHEAILAQRLPA
jgi:hypothetical protein